MHMSQDKNSKQGKRQNIKHLNISNTNSHFQHSDPATPTFTTVPTLPSNTATSPPQTPLSPIAPSGALPKFYYDLLDFQIAQYLFAIVRIDNILHSLPKLVKKVSILNPLYKPSSPEATSFNLNNLGNNQVTDDSKLGAIPCISYIAIQTGFSFNLNSIPNDFLNEIFNNNKLPQDQLDNLKLLTLDNGMDTLIFKINQFNNDVSNFNLKSLTDYKETLVLVQQLQRLGLLTKSYYQKKLITHIKQRSNLITNLKPMTTGNSRFAKLYSDVSFLSDILDPTDLFNLSNFYINVDRLSSFKNNYDDTDKAVQLTFSGLPVFLNLLHIYLKKLKTTINPYHSYSFVQQKHPSNEIKYNLFQKLPYAKYTVHRLNAIILKLLEVYTALKRFNCLINALQFDKYLDENIEKNDESIRSEERDDTGVGYKSILVNNDKDCINNFKVYLKKFDYCFSNEFEIIIYLPIKKFVKSSSSKTNIIEANNKSLKNSPDKNDDLLDQLVDIEAIDKLISKVLRNFKLVVNVYNILKLLYNEYLILVNEEIELEIGASTPVATPIQDSYPSNISSNKTAEAPSSNNINSGFHNHSNGNISSSVISVSNNSMKSLESPSSDISMSNSFKKLSKTPSLASSEPFVESNRSINNTSTTLAFSSINNLPTSNKVLNSDFEIKKSLSASSSPSKKNKNHLKIITKGILSSNAVNNNIVLNKNNNINISLQVLENDLSPLILPLPLQKWSRIGFLDRFSSQSTNKKYNSINGTILEAANAIQTPNSASSKFSLIRSSSASCADEPGLLSVRKILSIHDISDGSAIDDAPVKGENFELNKNEVKRHRKSSSTGFAKAIELSRIGKILNKNKDSLKPRKQNDINDLIDFNSSLTNSDNDKHEEDTDRQLNSKFLTENIPTTHNMEESSSLKEVRNDEIAPGTLNIDFGSNRQFSNSSITASEIQTVSTHENADDSYEIEFRLETASTVNQTQERNEGFEKEYFESDQMVEVPSEQKYLEISSDGKNGIEFELQIDLDSDGQSEEISILSIPESKEVYESNIGDSEIVHDEDRSVDIASLNKIDDTDIKYLDDTTTDEFFDDEEDEHAIGDPMENYYKHESVVTEDLKDFSSKNTSRVSQIIDSGTISCNSSAKKLLPSSKAEIFNEFNDDVIEYQKEENVACEKTNTIIVPSISIEDTNFQEERVKFIDSDPKSTVAKPVNRDSLGNVKIDQGSDTAEHEKMVEPEKPIELTNMENPLNVVDSIVVLADENITTPSDETMEPFTKDKLESIKRDEIKEKKSNWMENLNMGDTSSNKTLGNEPDISKKLDQLNLNVILNEEIETTGDNNDINVYTDDVLEFVRPNTNSEKMKSSKAVSSENILDSILDITSDDTSDEDQNEDDLADGHSVVIFNNDDKLFKRMPNIINESEKIENTLVPAQEEFEEVDEINPFEKNREDTASMNNVMNSIQTERTKQPEDFFDNTFENIDKIPLEEGSILDEADDSIKKPNSLTDKMHLFPSSEFEDENCESDNISVTEDNHDYVDPDINLFDNNTNIKANDSILNFDSFNDMPNKRDTFKVLDEDLKMIIEKIANFSDSELYEDKEASGNTEKKSNEVSNIKSDCILVIEEPNKLKKKKSIIIHHLPRPGARSLVLTQLLQDCPAINHTELHKLYDLSDIISLISGDDLSRATENLIPISETKDNLISDSIEQIISNVDVRENESIIDEDVQSQSNSTKLSRKLSIGLLYKKLKENGSKSSVNITLTSTGNEHEKDGRKSKVISKILDVNEYSAILQFLNLEEEVPATPDNIIIKNVGPSNAVVNVTRCPKPKHVNLTNNTAFQKNIGPNKSKQNANNFIKANYARDQLFDIEEDKRNAELASSLSEIHSVNANGFPENMKQTSLPGNDGIPAKQLEATPVDKIPILVKDDISLDSTTIGNEQKASEEENKSQDQDYLKDKNFDAVLTNLADEAFGELDPFKRFESETENTEGVSIKTPSLQENREVITREEVARVLREIENSPSEPNEANGSIPKFEQGKDNICIINTPPSPTTLPSTVGENSEIKLDLNKYSSYMSNLFDYNINHNMNKYNPGVDLRMSASNFYDSSQYRLNSSRQQPHQQQQIIFQSSYQNNSNSNMNKVIVEEQLVGFHDNSSEFNIESPRSPDTSFGYLHYYDNTLTPRNVDFSNIIESHRQFTHNQQQNEREYRNQQQQQQSKLYNQQNFGQQFQTTLYSNEKTNQYKHENKKHEKSSSLMNTYNVDNGYKYKARNLKNFKNSSNNNSDGSMSIKQTGKNAVKQPFEKTKLQTKTLQQKSIPKELVEKSLPSPPKHSQPLGTVTSNETNPFNYMFDDVPKRSERRTKNPPPLAINEKMKNHSVSSSKNSNELKSPIMSNVHMKFFRNDSDCANEVGLRINPQSNMHGFQNDNLQQSDTMFYSNKVPPQTAGLPFSDTTLTISNSKYGGDESVDISNSRNAGPIGTNNSNLQIANNMASNMRSNAITGKISSTLGNEGNSKPENSNNENGNNNSYHNPKQQQKFNLYDNIVNPIGSPSRHLMVNGEGNASSRSYGLNDVDDFKIHNKNSKETRYGSKGYFNANNLHDKKDPFTNQHQPAFNYSQRKNNFKYINHDDLLTDENATYHQTPNSPSNNSHSGGPGPNNGRLKLWGSKSRNANSITNNTVTVGTSNSNGLSTPSSATFNGMLNSSTPSSATFAGMNNSSTVNNNMSYPRESSANFAGSGNGSISSLNEPILVVGGGNGFKLGKSTPKRSVFPKMSNSEGIGAIAAMKILEPITSDDKPITNGKKGDDGILWLDDRQIEAYNKELFNMKRNSNGELDSSSIGDDVGAVVLKNGMLTNKGKNKNNGFRARFINKHKINT